MEDYDEYIWSRDPSLGAVVMCKSNDGSYQRVCAIYGDRDDPYTPAERAKRIADLLNQHGMGVSPTTAPSAHP